jgi:cell wall-associated NlpC family hydrolase
MAARSSGLGSGLISGSTAPQPKALGRFGRYESRMRRPVLLAACCLSLLAPPALAATRAAASYGPNARKLQSVVPPKSWDKAEIRLVVNHGLMARSVASFRANDVLTQGELATLVAALTQQPADVPANPAAPVSVVQLDARLVKALELSDTAAGLLSAARAAGLSVPSRFGTETVARLLGLRTNHLAKDDDLELLPNDPVTRAETAYSVAKILRFSGGEQQYVEDAAMTFVLPAFTSWQKRVLKTAVRFIGFPYVWGGMSEKAEAPFGVQARGGFDCSGFVWRVYKLQTYPGGAVLNATINGRTTYQMSGEVPRSKRIAFANLAPGDLLFFGPKGPRSKPSSIGHTGIYLGSGWMIHSSGQGVAVVPLSGWYRNSFAWGRRPLAEAGLVAG